MRKAILALGLTALLGCSEPAIKARTGIEERYESAIRPELTEMDDRKLVFDTFAVIKPGSDLSYGNFRVNISGNSTDDIRFKLSYDNGSEKTILFLNHSSYLDDSICFSRDEKDGFHVNCKEIENNMAAIKLYRKTLHDAPLLMYKVPLAPDQKFMAAYRTMESEERERLNSN